MSRFLSPKFLVLLALPLLLAPSPQPQVTNLHYKVFGKGNEIGYVNVIRTIAGDKVTIETHNETTAHFFKSIHVKHDLVSEFTNGKLTRSEIKVLVNGKPHDHSILTWEGNEYKLWSDGKTKTIAIKAVDATPSLLFFEEPKGKDRVFSEQFGEWFRIEHNSDNTYEMVKHRGHRNVYHYVDGVLKDANFGNTFLDTHLQLVN